LDERDSGKFFINSQNVDNTEIFIAMTRITAESFSFNIVILNLSSLLADDEHRRHAFSLFILILELILSVTSFSKHAFLFVILKL